MSIIVRRDSLAYGPRMGLRSITATLIALAMLLVPLALQSGAAMAMAPDQHSQMSTAGHCDEQPPQKQDGGASDMSCCAAMCTGIAVDPASQVEPLGFASAVDRPGFDPFRHGFLAELPTPPPRLA